MLKAEMIPIEPVNAGMAHPFRTATVGESSARRWA